MPDMRYAAGMDGGGTKTVLEARAPDGRVLLRERFGPLNLNSAAAQAVRETMQGCTDALARLPGGLEACAALCVGSAGVSNPQARALALRRNFLIGLIHDNPNAQMVLGVQEGILAAIRDTEFALVVRPVNRRSPDMLDDVRTFLDQQRLGKPKDEADALRMLTDLAGRRHTVCTGVTLRQGQRSLTRAQSTDVYFRPAGREELMAYIRGGEPMDKAGAYGVQGQGALLVERIDGDFFNVMGLPVLLLSRMLAEFGVTLL